MFRLFLHPRCSCSEATLTQLIRIAPQLQTRAKIQIYFFAPTAKPAAWVEGSELWRIAREIPGVESLRDPEGRYAQEFRAHTSGDVVLFDEDAKLIFRGGLTPARGHPGESRGTEIITRWLRGQPGDETTGKTFGCGLTQISHSERGAGDES